MKTSKVQVILANLDAINGDLVSAEQLVVIGMYSSMSALVHERCKKQHPPFIKLGSRVVYLKDEVRKFLLAHPDLVEKFEKCSAPSVSDEREYKGFRRLIYEGVRAKKISLNQLGVACFQKQPTTIYFIMENKRSRPPENFFITACKTLYLDEKMLFDAFLEDCLEYERKNIIRKYPYFADKFYPDTQK